MSQNQVVIFDAPSLPAVLLSQEALDLGRALTGGLGSGINRISLKGNRFRLIQSGQEIAVLEQSTLDVVIVKSSPGISRIYYKDKYSAGDKIKPTCWSKDGVRPDASVSAETKQAANCASCQQNIKGSAVGENGAQSRACAFRKRIVVVSPDQLGNSGEPEAYALDVNALSLFGDGDPSRNQYGLGGYGKFLNTPRAGFPSGIPPFAVITRMSIDSNSSVPKLFFGVSTNDSGRAAFLNEKQINEAMALAKTDAVLRMVEQSTDELLAPEVDAAATPLPAPTKPVAAPPPPPPPKVLTWQEVAAEAGADEDDIESIEEVGGPSTEKGLKRWNKVAALASIKPPGEKAVEKPKAAKPKAEATKNPFATGAVEAKSGFGAASAPAVASAPAKPQGVTAAVGAKLADAMTAFDDE